MIIAAFNPKGGVGKTTTAVNVAASLARTGKSVLLVDLEADLNASISLGIGPGHADAVDRRGAAARTASGRCGAPGEGLRPPPPAPGIARPGAHRRAAAQRASKPERRLADVIRPLVPDFDVIVLDSPAGYSLVSLSVPLAAEHLIVPIRADYLSLESLAQFLRWYRDRRRLRRATAHMAGILLTMVDYRRQATREIVDIIRVHNPRGVFRTEIPHDQRVPEAPSHGLPLGEYARRCRAAVAYDRFTSELMKRVATRG
jgi:chromosome partitioning protein